MPTGKHYSQHMDNEQRLCGCGEVLPDGVDECYNCWRERHPTYRPRPMSRTERLQGLADRGVDTWEELRGER